LTIGLGVIWSCNVVLCTKLFQEVSEGLINEVRPSVTYHHPWCPKARKYDLMEHPSSMLGVGSTAWHCFYPLGHIINCHQDVYAVIGLWEWSHEVNAPYVK